MADSITKDIAIYRLTNTGDTEANIADDDSVGCDDGMTDQTVIGVVGYSWDGLTRRTNVPNPSSNALSNPDTKLQGLTLTILLKVNEKIVAPNRKIGILTMWGIDDKTTDSFPKARFGIRNNFKPWCNFVPTDTAGWKLVDVNVDDIIEFGGLCDCALTLEYTGPMDEIITTIKATLGE